MSIDTQIIDAKIIFHRIIAGTSEMDLKHGNDAIDFNGQHKQAHNELHAELKAQSLQHQK